MADGARTALALRGPAAYTPIGMPTAAAADGGDRRSGEARM
jgi:hypothetical protein